MKHPWSFDFNTDNIQATMTVDKHYYTSFNMNNLFKPAGYMESSGTTAHTSIATGSQALGYNNMSTLGYDVYQVLNSAFQIYINRLPDDNDDKVFVYGFLTLKDYMEAFTPDSIEEAFVTKSVPTMQRTVVTRDKSGVLKFNWSRSGFPLYLNTNPMAYTDNANIWVSTGATPSHQIVLQLYFVIPAGAARPTDNWPSVEFKTRATFNTLWSHYDDALNPSAAVEPDLVPDAQD